MATRFAALSNPQRLRILSALQREGRAYVSALARKVGLSRPLLHLHLAKLVEAGFVESSMELSDDGKALHFFQIVPFHIEVTPERIATAMETAAKTRPGGDPASGNPTEE